MDSETFPENFPDIGSWTFLKVWEDRKDFCKFSLNWDNPTGLFKKFQKYCKQKITNVSRPTPEVENASRNKGAA